MSAAPLLPGPILPCLITPTPKSPSPSTSRAPRPPTGGFDLPSASGDTASTEGLSEKEDHYTVTFDNDLPTSNQTSVPKLFDIDTYLMGDIDIDDLLDSVN